MSETRTLLAYDSFRLGPTGEGLTGEIHSSETWAVMGRSGSGKSDFLKASAGLISASHGKAVLACHGAWAPGARIKKRQTPSGLLTATATKRDKAELLVGLGLVDDANEHYGDLPSSHAAACDLLTALAGDEEMVFIDGLIDRLDPWARKSVLAMVAQQSVEGRSFLVSTCMPEVAEALGSIVILSSGAASYFGGVRDLIEHAGPAELVVEADDESTVREICQPFGVTIRSEGGKLLLTADEGQEAAARLLVEGYGVIRAITIRERSLAEVLQDL
jgi:ABC-type multidrug transport system ATPase subunit